MYTLKQTPEDFIVEEVISLSLNEKGRYTYFQLKKKGLNSEEAIQSIAAFQKRPRKFFSYAGNKDRQALTMQYCSYQGDMEDFSLPGIKVKVIGKGDSPIHLGMHSENKFVITARNLSSQDIEAFQRNYAEMQSDGFLFKNYFDSQRFSKNNPEVGKAIIKKDFEKAVSLISGYREIAEYLNAHPRDFVGALRRLPQKTLQIYVHAYQSKLWNILAEESDSKRNIKIPLIGFGTESLNKKEALLLESEGIGVRDFIIRQLPVSAEGNERMLYSNAKDFRINSTGDDDLNPGKSKITVEFALPKASYATIFVKQLFRNQPR
jgi:tRNA pseudouridine13 synthase